MTDTDDARARLIKATRRYRALEKARDELTAAVVDALRARVPPTEVAELSPWTDRYIRNLAREHGIEPAPPGPKRGTKES